MTEIVYIDAVIQDNFDNLVFKGEINGWLASKIKSEKYLPYELTFQRVLTYFVCELDTYENIAGCSHLDYSDFNVVENSE